MVFCKIATIEDSYCFSDLSNKITFKPKISKTDQHITVKIKSGNLKKRQK